MDETKIRITLEKEQAYVDEARTRARAGDLNGTGYYLAMAKRAQDEISGVLMGLEPDEEGLAKLTPRVMQNAKRTLIHPFAVKCIEIYSEGLSYCREKLSGVLN